MATATKAKKQEPKELYFRTTGEYLTNFARETWVSDLPKKAIAILKECGMSKDQILLTISGKMKLTGEVRIGTSDTMGWEKDNVKELYGIKLDVQTMIGRLEKKYVELSESRNCLNEAPDGTYDDDHDSDNDYRFRQLKGIENQIKDIMDNLEVLYPEVKKTMKDLPTDRVRSYKKIRQDALAQSVEEIKTDKRRKKLMKMKDFNEVMNSEEMAEEKEKFIESFSLDNEKKKISDKRFSNLFGGSYYIVPITIDQCKDEFHKVVSGWLLPDGTFYGGSAYPYIHRDILSDLEEETDFFKKADYGNDEDGVQGAGWIKRSGGHGWLIYQSKRDGQPTNEQIQFMIDYAINVDEQDFIDILNHRIKLTSLAKVLDGSAEFDLYKLEKDGENE